MLTIRALPLAVALATAVPTADLSAQHSTPSPAAASYDTGGLGTGSGLGNQGGIAFSDDHRWLFVVNAGSDTITSFAVTHSGLHRVDVANAQGARPISLTAHHDLLYVLDAGGQNGSSDNIAGFRILPNGHLAALTGSSQPLSGTDTNPAQIGFSPDGRHLVVTEKGTNSLDVYAVDRDGFAGVPSTFASAGATPFGFDFDNRGRLLVSEAHGGMPDASSVSVYAFARTGDLVTLDATVQNTETAACWLVVSKDGRNAYVTNTGSNSVSGYAIQRDGTALLLDPDGVTGTTGMNGLAAR